MTYARTVIRGTWTFDSHDVVAREMGGHKLACIRRTEHVAHTAHDRARLVRLVLRQCVYVRGHQVSSAPSNRRGDSDLAENIAAGDKWVPPPESGTEAEHNSTRDHRADAGKAERQIASPLDNR